MTFTSAKNLPLTMDQIRKAAPSVFATEAWSGVSDRYSFIPTINVVESLMAEGWNVMKATQSGTRVEGKEDFTKHVLRFRRPGTDLVVGDVFPEIVLLNSHDRGSAYQMHAGLFRLACSNGLIVDDATFCRLSLRHTGKIIDDVRRGADEIVKELPHIQREVSIMQAIELTPNERGIFAAAAMPLKFEENTPIQPSQLLRAHRYGDDATDVWTTMNTIQENMIRGGVTYRTQASRNDRGEYVPSRRQRTREVKGIAEDTRLNKSLFHLANEMKRLKMSH